MSVHRKLNTKGFVALEAMLIVVIIAIIGGTGYYVWHANQKSNDTLNRAAKDASGSPKFSPKKKAASTNVASLQQVSLQTNGQTLETLQVPSSWGVTVAHKTNDGSARIGACSLTTSSKVVSLDYGSTTPPGVTTENGFGLVNFDVVKQPDTKSLESYFQDDVYGGYDSGIHTFTNMTINGNPAVLYNGSGRPDGSDYRQQYYLVSHHGYVACLKWRYYDKGQLSATNGTTDSDFSQYLNNVSAIAKSIKFPN